MPSVDQQRQKLVTLLKELFQINQPDLDFGFYRIMHAKSEEVSRFLDEDLLQIIADAFGESSAGKQAEMKKAYLDEIEKAREYGVQDPESSPKVQEAKSRWEAAMDTSGAEGEVYDHLYRFFERYYDNGDFLSKRYYARESATKAAPYAVPYDGSEVYLHWANKDQYYIKTSEYFTDFTFDLSKAKEVEGKIDPLFSGQAPPPLRVHFRIAEATEGEHGNIKAASGKRRYFILHNADPVSLENGELTIRFEYRPDPEKSGQDAVWQRKRMEQAVEKIFSILNKLKGVENFTRLLKVAAPTEKQKDRTLLAKYLARYTARNTMDYFIHKDLGGFLQRELDFYIKNEIIRLDDIENADAPRVEQYLAKIKVLRKIARKIIAFLAQLEEFQKKLWLKKKFVTETNYCITIDRIPEELYSEIIANEAQIDEWIRLFAIDEIAGDLHSTAYSRPISLGFLKENKYLVVDTKFFSSKFKDQFLSSIHGPDTQIEGTVINSDSFHSLNLTKTKYQSQIDCAYIDPPYNTGKDGFPYKDSFKDSSWISMILDRLKLSKDTIGEKGALFSSIDEIEFNNLKSIISSIFGQENHLADFVWLTEGNFDNQAKIKWAHEYLICYAKNEKKFPNPPIIDPSISNTSKLYNEEIRNTIVKNGLKNPVSEIILPTGFPASFSSGIVEPGNISWPRYSGTIKVENYKTQNEVTASSGWSSKALCQKFISNRFSPILDSKMQSTKFELTKTGAIESIKERKETQSYVTTTIKSVGTTQSTSAMLEHMGTPYPHYPKPILLLQYILSMTGTNDLTILDYFAGSGSVAHATINLNRNKNVNHKYILMEIAEYFDSVIIPRIQKSVYAEIWKNGKPVNRNTGISHCFKYLRLESYEDCLNNLEFKKDEVREKATAGNKEFREDYMLHYMLETETRGSQSLLNIDSFVDPTAYKLKVKKPGTDEYEVRNVDLIETFNYLIGLRVEHMDAPQAFTAKFKREPDPELPDDKHTRLKVAGRKQAEDGPWWFRKIEGWLPGNNGRNEKVLVVWRKLTGDPEKDNLMLDEWFKTIRINPRDFEFDTIYVNGSNNLPNLRLEGENWKVRLIEEDFMKRMWEVEDV